MKSPIRTRDYRKIDWEAVRARMAKPCFSADKRPESPIATWTLGPLTGVPGWSASDGNEALYFGEAAK